MRCSAACVSSVGAEAAAGLAELAVAAVAVGGLPEAPGVAIAVEATLDGVVAVAVGRGPGSAGLAKPCAGRAAERTGGAPVAGARAFAPD
jgi:hypothetical protein